ncbi:MAG: LacI family DNA-binding transcriptional regulator [Christensenellales bacterium]
MNEQKKQYLGVRDIAKLAGASIASVSRVLNHPETVSEKMRDKVMAVVREYDYTPNLSAKNLFSGTSTSIALFVDDMANPFFTSYIKSLNSIAFRNDYTLLICDGDVENGDDIEEKFYNYCKSLRTSGIVLTSGTHRTASESGESFQSVPVVLLDRESFGSKACFEVHSDYRKGMMLLIEYLHKLGHRRIGYTRGKDHTLSAKLRYEAFLEYTQKLGLDIPANYIKESDYTITSGIEAFDYFYSMPDAPTAIIAANDQNARGFILRANSLGVKIPEEFSVCGFDAIEPDAFYPQITSIRQDTRALAQATFDFIVSGKHLTVSEEKIIDVSMSIGTTCVRNTSSS